MESEAREGGRGRGLVRRGEGGIEICMVDSTVFVTQEDEVFTKYLILLHFIVLGL